MKDYVSKIGLSRFLEKLYEKFSLITHTHTIADITDFDSASGGSGENATVQEVTDFLNIVYTPSDIPETIVATMQEVKDYLNI